MVLIAHIDGASKGNPGPAGIGYSIEKDGIMLEEYSEFIGETTNNTAEYRALLAALTRLKQLGGRDVTIFSDSELIVRQINGMYKVKKPKLQQLHADAMHCIGEFDSFRILHIPRHRNSHADGLANRALKAHRKAQKKKNGI